MNTLQMLHKMCHDELSQTDVNAIRDSRGFSEQETATRALLENFYLSETGVEQVMRTLSDDEVVFLHLLAFLGESVAIPLFARLYKDVDRPDYGTYTQRYKPIFDHVRVTLIRKGILLFAEDPALKDADTQNERRRYRFPRQFRRFLPPPVRDIRRFDRPGSDRAEVLRKKLYQITSDDRAISEPTPIEKSFAWTLTNGELRMGRYPFQVKRLLAWQRKCWTASVPSSERNTRRGWPVPIRETTPTVAPVKAVEYLFSQLERHAWVRPEQLMAPLRIFCGFDVESSAVCQAGWRWGRLARREADGEIYYRWVPKSTLLSSRADAAEYLTSPDESGVSEELRLDLERIPYTALEYINLIADLRRADGDGAYLAAVPDAIKIGRQIETVRDHALTPWLRENAPAFRAALERVEARWGQHIIHEGLLVAHVDDLGLRVQLERAFRDDKSVVFLRDDVLAFPRQKLRDVKRIVSNAGHVMKVVTNDA